MVLMRGILRCNLFALMQVLQSIGIMYGIFQCKFKVGVRNKINAAVVCEILLLIEIIFTMLHSGEKLLWIEGVSIGLLGALLIFRDKWFKVASIYFVSEIFKYYISEFVRLMGDLLYGKNMLRSGLIETKIIVFIFTTGIIVTLVLLVQRNSNLQKKIEDTLELYYGVFLIYGIICSLVLYNVVAAYSSNTKNLLGAMSVFCTIVFCLMFGFSGFVLMCIDKSRKLNQEQRYLKENYIEMQKEFYNTTFQADQSLREFQQDVFSHLEVLGGLIKERKTDETVQYLGFITENIDNETETMLWSNRPIVDALLNRMEKIARMNQVDLQLRGGFGDGLLIEDYDLCTILYNGVENGIRACKEIQNNRKRSILIEIGRFKNSLDLRISNEISEKEEIVECDFENGKDEGMNYKYGINNIKDIVRKYEGMIDFYHQANSFLIEIVFFEAYKLNESKKSRILYDF